MKLNSVFLKVLLFISFLVIFSMSKAHAFFYNVLIGYENVSPSYVSSHFTIKELNNYKHVKIMSAYADANEIEKMKKDSHITFVTFNNNFKADATEISFSPKISNKPTVSSTYNDKNKDAFSLIRLNEARKEGLTGKNITVCVVDSGIDTTHEALKGKVLDAKSFMWEPNGKYTTTDYFGHGTHVAGIIAGQNLSKTFTGVAPDVKLYSAKVFNKDKDSNSEGIINAVDWCISKKPKVINMSLGIKYEGKGNAYDVSLDALKQSLKNAYDNGIINVASAGNEGYESKDNVGYPGRFPYVLAVASSDSTGFNSAFSSRGPSVGITAPGDPIYSSFPFNLDTDDDFFGDTQNGYTELFGTSMSAPVASGVIALMREKYPNLTNQQILNIVKSISIDKGTKGKDSLYGCGIIQAYPISSSVLTKAPATPVLTSYDVVNKKLVLKWNRVYDCDLSGYRVFINNKKTNPKLLSSTTYSINISSLPKNFTIQIQAIDELNNKATSKTTKASILFSDISSAHWAYSPIKYVSDKKWINGMSDGSFQPTKPLTRAEVAVTLSRVINLSSYKSSSKYRDVAKTNWAYTAISKVSNAKIMTGSSSTMFLPNKQITRAEMAVMLNRLLKEKAYTGNSPFTDIKNPTYFAYSSILTMKNSGYFNGCSTTKFCPNRVVTRAEFASLLERTGTLINSRN